MQYFDRHQGGEKAILVHMDVRCADKDGTLHNNDLEELKLLATSAGAMIMDTITGSLNRPHAKYFVGTGKADEIAAAVERLKGENGKDDIIAIFNHTLSPSQERNLEHLLQCRVLDRTGLILDIFAGRAKTFEGKLQVELAQLNHLSTRLVRGWTHLERQKGGIGLRGPGETQLETDRRLLQIRVGQLKTKLDKVKQTRAIGRARRQKSDIPTISLVGYTNAGKSTLFNRLTGDNIYAADQLFATLDPTLRSIAWQGLGKVVLADTVGFVKNLPHELVESFHATLEETLQADLLLHVIDTASDNIHEEIDAVNAVLAEIGADSPILMVHNKIDKSGDDAKIIYQDKHIPQKVYISAAQGLGIDYLTQAVTELLAGTIYRFDLTLPADKGALASELHSLNIIDNISYNEHGQACISLSATAAKVNQLLAKHKLCAADVLPAKQALRLQPALEPFEKSESSAP